MCRLLILQTVHISGGLVREYPQNALNSGLGIIVICPEYLIRAPTFTRNIKFKFIFMASMDDF